MHDYVRGRRGVTESRIREFVAGRQGVTEEGENGGKWVTTESGTHIHIGEGGTIDKGPVALVGKSHEGASSHEREHGKQRDSHKLTGGSGRNFPPDVELSELPEIARKKLGNRFHDVRLATYGGGSQIEVRKRNSGMNGYTVGIAATYPVPNEDVLAVKKSLGGKSKPTGKNSADLTPEEKAEITGLRPDQHRTEIPSKQSLSVENLHAIPAGTTFELRDEKGQHLAGPYKAHGNGQFENLFEFRQDRSKMKDAETIHGLKEIWGDKDARIVPDVKESSP